MLVNQPQLFLPVSEQTVRRVVALAGDAGARELLADCTPAELAALLALQNVLELRPGESLANLERNLAAAMEVLQSALADRGREAVACEMAEHLDVNKLRLGVDGAAERSVAFLEDEAVHEARYLDDKGAWDYGFSVCHLESLYENCERIRLPSGEAVTLTDSQSRLFRLVRAEIDDNLHVQGYAGTGKTFLILRAIIETLMPRGARIALLAETWRQVQVLTTQCEHVDGVVGRTLGQIATDMIPPDLTRSDYSRLRRKGAAHHQVSDAMIASAFGITGEGSFSAQQIAKAARGTVASYCGSDDEHINVKHVPKRFAAVFNVPAKQQTVVAAHAIWQSTIRGSSPNLPLYDYHRIKLAALNGWSLPAQYTHIVIDECHNLSKAMLQILDRSTQVVISLGDEYQRLRGLAHRRAEAVRQREMSHSVRCGKAIETLANPIIAVHRGQTKAPFEGNKLNPMKVSYYQKVAVPEQPSMIMVNDYWALFEWSQRLAKAGATFNLFSDYRALSRFVADCIELYTTGTRARHRDLFRFSTWDAVAAYHGNDPGFQRIDAMLRQGYRAADWDKTRGAIDESGKAPFGLANVRDVRNLEFDTVFITPDVVRIVADAEGDARDAAAAALYVAITRARHEIHAPAALRNWIEDISATHHVSRPGSVLHW